MIPLAWPGSGDLAVVLRPNISYRIPVATQCPDSLVYVAVAIRAVPLLLALRVASGLCDHFRISQSGMVVRVEAVALFLCISAYRAGVGDDLPGRAGSRSSLYAIVPDMVTSSSYVIVFRSSAFVAGEALCTCLLAGRILDNYTVVPAVCVRGYTKIYLPAVSAQLADPDHFARCSAGCGNSLALVLFAIVASERELSSVSYYLSAGIADLIAFVTVFLTSGLCGVLEVPGQVFSRGGDHYAALEQHTAVHAVFVACIAVCAARRGSISDLCVSGVIVWIDGYDFRISLKIGVAPLAVPAHDAFRGAGGRSHHVVHPAVGVRIDGYGILALDEAAYSAGSTDYTSRRAGSRERNILSPLVNVPEGLCLHIVSGHQEVALHDCRFSAAVIYHPYEVQSFAGSKLRR